MPFLNLLKSNHKKSFVFTPECKKAFNALKDALEIVRPNYKLTLVHLDLGRRAVAYFFKRTSTAEEHYHSFELETLAIIYALRRFKVYLEGIQFLIVFHYYKL